MNVVQARLFAHLRPLYQRRQTLHIIISYRQRYLDLLLHEGEESAEQATADYAQRRAETEHEYQEAAAHKESLDTEIQTLEQQAAELAEEITTLTGRTDCLRE